MPQQVIINIVGSENVSQAARKAAEGLSGLGKSTGGLSAGANAATSSFKGLGSQLLGLAATYQITSKAAEFLGQSFAAAKESAAAGAQMAAVIKSTGGAAGVTQQELEKMAASLQKVTMFSDEAVMGGQSMLLTFTNIGRDVFPQATQTMLDLSQAMGQDIKSSAIQLGKALNDPIAGMTALTRVGVTFSESQKQVIGDLVRTGDLAGAQRVILAELNKEFGGSAEAARNAAGGTADLAVAYGDLQEKFGGLMVAMSNSAAADMAVSFLDKLAAGAEAYSIILNEQIPAIQNHEAAMASDAAKTLIASDNYDVLDDAVDKGAKAFDSFRDALITNVKSHADYQKAVDKVAQSNIELAGKLDMTEDEFAKLKQAMVSSGPAAQGFISHLNQMQTAAALTAKANAAVTASIKTQAAAQAAASVGMAGMTNREKDALAQLYNARANQPEMQTDWNNQVDQEKRDEAEKTAVEQTKLAEKSNQAMTKSFDAAVDNMRSTIEGVLKPSLDEVWKGGGDTQHIDEWARRLATVATSGLQSEWIPKLTEQFGGQDFFKPITDALQSGDDGALKEAAAGVLNNSVMKLWDPEVIKQKIKDQLSQANMKEELIKQIQAELGAEGITVDPATIAKASGDSEAAAGTMAKSMETAGTEIDKGLEPANLALMDLDNALLTSQNALTTFVSEVSTKFKIAGDKVIGFQSTIKEGKWADIGEAIIKGLVTGISENLYQVNEVLKDLAKEAIDAARDELGIQSPSKEFFRIAELIVAGLTGGINAKGPSFQKAISNMLKLDKDTFDLKSMVGFAADEVEEVMEGMNMEGDKVQFALRHMKDALRANLTAVAKGSGAELKSILENAVGSWEKAGLGGEAGKALNSGMDAFVSQIIRLRTEFPKMAEEARKANLEKMFGGFNKFSGDANSAFNELGQRIAVVSTMLRSGLTEFHLDGQIMDAAGAQAHLNSLIAEQLGLQDDIAALNKTGQTINDVQRLNAGLGLAGSLRAGPGMIGAGAAGANFLGQSALGQMLNGKGGMGLIDFLTKQGGSTYNNVSLTVNSNASQSSVLQDMELLQSLLSGAA